MGCLSQLYMGFKMSLISPSNYYSGETGIQSHTKGFPGDSDSKESACNVEDLSLTPGLGRSPGRGHGNPLQYSCLENPHGLRNMVGYAPWGCKELHTTQPKITHNTASWQSVFMVFANIYYIFSQYFLFHFIFFFGALSQSATFRNLFRRHLLVVSSLLFLLF